MGAELSGKDFDFLRLHPHTAIHGKRQTDYDLPDLMLANDANNSLYVCLVMAAVDNGQRAGQYTQRVAERHPNPFVTNIKSQATRDTPLQT